MNPTIDTPPTFFLSSTIYDFKDLRSAIKFYLTEQGFTVLASEFNDFPKPLDSHSYHACIESLKKADYFILLIGSRVGGWYDKENKISITRHEYREAYKLHLERKIKIITLVRGEIWQFKEQRSELINFLKKINLSNELQETIKNAPSKFADDADFISEFISEVSKNAETKNAIIKKGNFPTGNWVHVFHDFREVIETIQTQTSLRSSVGFMAFKKVLTKEIQEILKRCLIKFKPGHIYSPLVAVEFFHKTTQLPKRLKHDSEIEIGMKEWRRISLFSFSLMTVKINSQTIDLALQGPYFLTYSFEEAQFVEQPIYKGLFLLQKEIRSIDLSKTTEIISFVTENSPSYYPEDTTSIALNALKLMQLLYTMDRWSNIVTLSIHILKHLNGTEFEMPKLRPQSPIKDMVPELEAEQVNDEDLIDFLKMK